MLCIRSLKNVALLRQIHKNQLYACPNCYNLFKRNCKKINKETDTKMLEKFWDKLKPAEKMTKRIFESSYMFIPVHMTSTVLWFFIFIWLYKHGVNLIQVIASIDFEDVLIEHVEHTPFASFFISLLLLKATAPFRYVLSVTLAFLIPKYLRRRRKKKLKKQGNK